MHRNHRPLHRIRKYKSPHPRARFPGSRHAIPSGAHATPPTDNAIPPLPVLEDDPIPTISPFPGGKPLTEHEHKFAEDLHDWILGGQDGIVNILGTILAIAAITPNKLIVLAAGCAALFAESISMAAVAYSSVKASQSYYESEREAQRKLIEENPFLQRELLIDAYERKGLSRADARRVVTELTRNKEIWLEMLMEEHLHLYAPEEAKPLRSAVIVGTSATVGSLIPLTPFFFATGITGILWSAGVSVAALFGAGALSAKITIGDWKKRGLEMAAIGMIAGMAGFGIGWLLIRSGLTIF